MGLPFVIFDFIAAKGKSALFIKSYRILLRKQDGAFCAFFFRDFLKLRKYHRAEMQPAVLLEHGYSPENVRAVFLRGKGSAGSGQLAVTVNGDIVAYVVDFVKFVFIALLVHKNRLAHGKGIRPVVFIFNCYVHKISSLIGNSTIVYSFILYCKTFLLDKRQKIEYAHNIAFIRR